MQSDVDDRPQAKGVSSRMAKRREDKSEKNIVYGSLYMDRGESFEYAESQIDEGIVNAPAPPPKTIVAFDIIATPAQIASGRAREWGQRILDYCDKTYPQLGARAVGITDDDHRRVMRDTLITRQLTGNEIDNLHLIELE